MTNLKPETPDPHQESNPDNSGSYPNEAAENSSASSASLAAPPIPPAPPAPTGAEPPAWLQRELGRARAPRPERITRPQRERLHQGEALQDDPARIMRQGFAPLLGAAVVEASNRGATQVEAEHLLLALLYDRTNPAAIALSELGFDYAAFSTALEIEREKSLAAAGTTPPDPERLRATRRVGRPRMGASSREAFQRLRPKARQRLTHVAIAAGLLSAGLGTVPRALAYADIDRDRLLDRLEAA